MKRLTAAHVLAGSFGLVASQDYNAPPPNLTTLPALSLFETWRPHIHVLPASGHIGDPCAHYVDPETGLFHVGFLHNNTGISSVYTDDLVHLFYTSVTSLPIHWTIPYVWGSESQSLAVTSNGGKNFTKLDRPPVIPGPPRADVTGFRDPYVFQNGHLDKALNSSDDTWYAVISGGVRDVGPGIFLYRSISDDFQDWEYLGNWFNASVNSTLGNGAWPRVSGYNWETANVFSLDRTGYNQNADTFMTFGVEGSYVPIRKSVTSMHEMLWASGHVSAQGSNATFSADMIGVLDWGLSAYAAAGKVVPSTARVSQHGVPDRFISYVWLNGDGFEQMKGFPTAQQGWNHTLLLPRELRMLPISNVVYNELAQETGSWRVASDQNPVPGSCTELETLGIDIARETYRAMTSVGGFTEPDRTITNQDREIIPFGTSPEAKFFILEAQITFPQSARQSDLQAGFQVLASELESTTIYYQFSNESIIIDRSNTSAAAKTTPGIDESLESGHLRLFDISDCCGGEGDGHTQCDSHVETLDLSIVVDNSVLEVYANSRFVMSTWARSWYANSTEIRFFHSGTGEVSFSNIHVQEGLYDAYPGRTR